MAISRNRSAGAKVTDEEYAQLEELAQARDLTVGEWCRQVLLAQLNSKPALPIEQMLLAEVLALRMIVLNLFRAVATGERLSEETILQIVAWADREKIPTTVQRLQPPPERGSSGG